MTLEHEEFAEENFQLSLEGAFELLYIRLQAFTGQYLFVDHAQTKSLTSQFKALRSFFNIDYDQIVVQRKVVELGNSESTFSSQDRDEAHRFAVGSDEAE